jgi:hypothetical protein
MHNQLEPVRFTLRQKFSTRYRDLSHRRFRALDGAIEDKAPGRLQERKFSIAVAAVKSRRYLK